MFYILITPVACHDKAKQDTGFKRFGISAGEACYARYVNQNNAAQLGSAAHESGKVQTFETSALFSFSVKWYWCNQYACFIKYFRKTLKL